MEKLLKLSDLLAWPCRQMARAIGLLLLVLTAVILYDVIGRKFFSTGSFKLQELEWHLHGAIALLGFGYAYTLNAHVRIDVFSSKIPERIKLWMEIFAILAFLIPMMSLLLWFGYEFAERAFIRNETSNGGVGLSNRWIIKSVVPLSALLTIFGGLSVALRCFVILKSPHHLNNPFLGEK
jgi:TRAP-type mannitol/chloroaromatic compound transport system permease small subunit